MLEGVELLEPEPAPDAEVQRIHVPSYLAAVRVGAGDAATIGHGLGTDDNPIFSGMHEASAWSAAARCWRPARSRRAGRSAR